MIPVRLASVTSVGGIFAAFADATALAYRAADARIQEQLENHPPADKNRESRDCGSNILILKGGDHFS
jgi:hypothetical protein